MSFLDNSIRSFILLGIFLYSIFFVYWENSFSYYNVLNAFTFVCYAFILLICANRKESFYNSRRLCLIVFVYSIIFVGLYLMMSDYYMGNTFLFSEVDAKVYEKHSFSLLNLPFHRWIHYLQGQSLGFDDWGTPMTQAMIFHIIPHKLFLNFVYVLFNTIGAVLLFKIGQVFMNEKYSFIAALSYTIASYLIFGMGSFTKEPIMVFIVIVSFYYLYVYWEHRKVRYLFMGIFFSILLLFFRVPVSLFLWASYGMLLVLGNNNRIKAALFVLIGFVVVVLALGIIIDNFNRYANGGEITQSYIYQTYSKFQKVVLYISSLIGPFPQLFEDIKPLSSKTIYGSGLLLKFLVVCPFWLGFVYSVRTKKKIMYPIFTFCILEMVSLGIVLDSLEFRKGLPHVPFLILAAFWYMSEYDEDADDEVIATPYYKRVKSIFGIWCIVVLIITITWNTLRT